MKEYFAIGDVHGEFSLLNKMLENFDPERHQIILIGDLNDRGKRSREALYQGMDLVKKFGAVYLKGNHEDMLLQFLQFPEDLYHIYCVNGGLETIKSLIYPIDIKNYSPSELAEMIVARHYTLIKFLTNLPLYYETDNFIFVHAGIDLSLENWKNTEPEKFLWIREPFFEAKNRTHKTIVFGHTITPKLYKDMETTQIWMSDNKIGIDGGAVFGGCLLGVIFSDEDIQTVHSISNVNSSY